ncbi:MAG: beta-propeller fold lactonase family protein, partial [Rhodothermales bacterium]|nr:beta-propeller fold lactonase family protein [Rhodothermales bacterium]
MINRFASQLVGAFVLASLFVVSACAQSGPAVAEPAALTVAPLRLEPAYVYICNQSSAAVSVIDSESLELVATVDLTALGFTANAKPHHIVVEPDGSFWYVTLIGANRILKFNRSNELVAQAEFETPGMLALHPTGNTLYVARSMTAVNPPKRMGVVNREDMSIEEVDVFIARPHALAVDPQGTFVFAGSMSENRFITYNIETEEIALHDIEGPIHAFVQFAFSPDGTRLVVGGELSAKFFVYDVTKTPELSVVKTMDMRMAPWHPAFTPDGRYVYIGNKMADVVTVVDMESLEIVTTIEGEGISQPDGSVVSADGRRVFVANSNLAGGHTMPMPATPATGADPQAHA